LAAEVVLGVVCAGVDRTFGSFFFLIVDRSVVQLSLTSLLVSTLVVVVR
jgi:hypothetical protein